MQQSFIFQYAFQWLWSSPDISAKNGSIRLQPRTVDLDGALNEARKVVSWQMRSPVSLQQRYERNSVVDSLSRHADTPPLLQLYPRQSLVAIFGTLGTSERFFFISQFWICCLTSAQPLQTFKIGWFSMVVSFALIAWDGGALEKKSHPRNASMERATAAVLKRSAQENPPVHCENVAWAATGGHHAVLCGCGRDIHGGIVYL